MTKMMVLHKDGMEIYDGDNSWTTQIIPDPAFTSLDGGRYLGYCLPVPEGAERFNRKKATAHMITLRRKAGVNFDDVYSAHASRFPGEAKKDVEFARSQFP